MAQSSFVKFSEQFASTVQDEVGKSITLHNRGVNQAGFYVLVGSSMPNVLFETAFLSNTEDEKFITSEKGQEKIAEGIAKAIKRYASEYAARLQKSKSCVWIPMNYNSPKRNSIANYKTFRIFVI